MSRSCPCIRTARLSKMDKDFPDSLSHGHRQRRTSVVKTRHNRQKKTRVICFCRNIRCSDFFMYLTFQLKKKLTVLLLFIHAQYISVVMTYDVVLPYLCENLKYYCFVKVLDCLPERIRQSSLLV